MKIKKTGRHTGAIKALRQSLRRRARNRFTKQTIKGVFKSLEGALKDKQKEKASEFLKKAYSVVDKAAKRGLLHWRTAARKKSRLGQKVSQTLK